MASYFLMGSSKQVRGGKDKKRIKVIHQGHITQPMNQGRITETKSVLLNAYETKDTSFFICWKRNFWDRGADDYHPNNIIIYNMRRGMILELVEVLYRWWFSFWRNHLQYNYLGNIYKINILFININIPLIHSTFINTVNLRVQYLD